MSTSQDVLFEERDTASGQKLGIVTLNVEKTLNSLNLGMVEAMLTQLAEWRDRRDIACLKAVCHRFDHCQYGAFILCHGFSLCG